MSYRNPLSVFSYDKPVKTTRPVKAVSNVVWEKAVSLPFGTTNWLLRNQGNYPIYYAVEGSEMKKPTHFETLDPDVTVTEDNIPRHIYVANKETTSGHDTSIYLEYWVPEEEKDRKKGEAGVMAQIRNSIGLLKEAFPGLWSFGGR